MDASILTTFFCFILLVLVILALNELMILLLVLVILALNELMILKRKVNGHLDRTDLHTSSLNTILSILQQIEAKQDLLFNNAPQAPGEMAVDDIGEGHSWYYPKIYLPENSVEDFYQPDVILSSTVTKKKRAKVVDLKAALYLAKQKLKEHQIKPLPAMLPKKRGRPKKAPLELKDR